MTDGPIMDAVDAYYAAHPEADDGGLEALLDAASPTDEPEYVPVDGWTPEQFPQITSAPIPYTTSGQAKPDPFMTITTGGWLFIEVGNVRFAIPDREEWEKLVTMGDRMWNTWERSHMDGIAQPMDSPPPPPGVSE